MVAAGIPAETIRRWGRRLPFCWRRCVIGAADELGGLSRAMGRNCSRAQKPSVWLYLSRCLTARKIPLCRGG